MLKNLLLTAAALITSVGTAVTANAQSSERRDRGDQQEQRHGHNEFDQGRPHHGQVRPSPGRYSDDGSYHNKRHYRGRYYNNGHYYDRRYRHNGRYYYNRYRHNGGWRYR